MSAPLSTNQYIERLHTLSNVLRAAAAQRQEPDHADGDRAVFCELCYTAGRASCLQRYDKDGKPHSLRATGGSGAEFPRSAAEPGPSCCSRCRPLPALALPKCICLPIPPTRHPSRRVAYTLHLNTSINGKGGTTTHARPTVSRTASSKSGNEAAGGQIDKPTTSDGRKQRRRATAPRRQVVRTHWRVPGASKARHHQVASGRTAPKKEAGPNQTQITYEVRRKGCVGVAGTRACSVDGWRRCQGGGDTS
jgi:hypothetical protein